MEYPRHGATLYKVEFENGEKTVILSALHFYNLYIDSINTPWVIQCIARKYTVFDLSMDTLTSIEIAL